MAAYRNGVRIDPEEFDRVSEEERTAAMQKYHKQRLRDSGTGAVQGGGNLSFGTPRKGKNTKYSYGGVRVR